MTANRIWWFTYALVVGALTVLDCNGWLTIGGGLLAALWAQMRFERLGKDAQHNV